MPLLTNREEYEMRNTIDQWKAVAATYEAEAARALSNAMDCYKKVADLEGYLHRRMQEDEDLRDVHRFAPGCTTL